MGLFVKRYVFSGGVILTLFWSRAGAPLINFCF